MFEVDEIDVPDTAEVVDSGSHDDSDDTSIGGDQDETRALLASLRGQAPHAADADEDAADESEDVEDEEVPAASVTGPTKSPAPVPFNRFNESRKELSAAKRANAQLEAKLELVSSQFQAFMAEVGQHKQTQTRQVEDEEIDYEKLYAEADPVTELAREIAAMKAEREAERQAREEERHASLVAGFEQQYMAEIQAAVTKYPLAQHVPVELTTIMQREGCSAEVAAKRLHAKLGGAITPQEQPKAAPVRRAAPLPPTGSGAVAQRKAPEPIGFDGSFEESKEWLRALRAKGVRGQ